MVVLNVVVFDVFDVVAGAFEVVVSVVAVEFVDNMVAKLL